MTYQLKRYLSKMAKRLGEKTPDEDQAEEAIQADLRRRKTEMEARTRSEEEEAKVRPVFFKNFAPKFQVNPDYKAVPETTEWDYTFYKGLFGKNTVSPRSILENFRFRDIFDRRSPNDPSILEMSEEQILMRLTEYFHGERFTASWTDKGELFHMEFEVVRAT